MEIACLLQWLISWAWEVTRLSVLLNSESKLEMSLEETNQPIGRSCPGRFLSWTCLTFITFSPKTGEPYSEEEYSTYCNVMESTPAWGGQVCLSNYIILELKYLWRGYVIL